MEDYEELGLSKNESKVYETLVQSGKLGAGEASGRSGVSYSKIYLVLNSLINKGLVHVVPEKSKKFAPSNPESLIKFIQEKQDKLEKAKEKAKQLKAFYDVKEKNPVSLNFGKKGFYKIVEQEKKTEKYDYSIRWTSEYRPDWAGAIERNKKAGKDMRFLSRYDKETESNVKKWLKITRNIRKIDNSGVAMSIKDDSEVMISLIKSNATLLIRDSHFAKIMKKLFLAYYESAEKTG